MKIPDKLLLGVVHLPPLPGSPRYGGGGLAPIIEHARRDAEALLAAGFDGYVIENYGDAPFFPRQLPRHTLTAMTRIACELPTKGKFVVANVLRNDALGALAVASAAGLQAIRVNVLIGAAVTDQGILEGAAAKLLRQRKGIAPDVAIFADVHVKHARPLGERPLEETAQDTANRALADGLVVSGAATGAATDLDEVRRVRAAVPGHPVLVGSGTTLETIRETYETASGLIVGTATKEGGVVSRPVNEARARELVAACRG